MTTTDSRRFLLLSAAGVVLFFLYQAWQADYPPAETPAAPAAAPVATAPPDEAPRAANAAAAPAPAGKPPVPANAGSVRVETDAFVARISLAGGDLEHLELKGYPISKDHPDQLYPLLDDAPGRRFELQSGLAGSEQPLVTHDTVFQSAKTQWTLADGADTLDVELQAQAAGATVTKRYRFLRGRYEFELEQRAQNTGAAPLTLSPYVRYLRDDYKPLGESRFVNTFSGIGLYEADGGSLRFRKHKYSALAQSPVDKTQAGGWISVLQHYFVAAILPPAEETHQFSARLGKNGAYLAQYVGAGATVAPGDAAKFDTRLYIGPRLQKSIGKVAPGLDLTVDYGILKPIAQPLFWLLDQFHTWTGNWGVAIILLTLSVKLLMYKLSEAQFRSMAKMKKFQPRIQELKERYGDDRERMQKAMMELYKKEGFNPLAGCWPLLVQFPVFISLYWVLLESVELRQASFAFWLHDLSAPDPYYVLPVLFGLSMWLQQKMSGQQAMDPVQQKMMQAMPIMLAAFFAFFPQGLVLYWFFSNLTGIAQQWVITKRLEKEGLSRR